MSTHLQDGDRPGAAPHEQAGQAHQHPRRGLVADRQRGESLSAILLSLPTDSSNIEFQQGGYHYLHFRHTFDQKLTFLSAKNCFVSGDSIMKEATKVYHIFWCRKATLYIAMIRGISVHHREGLP